MKAKVAISITTYADISDRSYGVALYDAYAATSDRLIPHRAAVWSTKYPIGSAKDLGDHWLTVMPFEARTEGVNTTARGNYRIGAEWMNSGIVSGNGKVEFRSELDPNGSDGLVIKHSYSNRIDWLQLFEKLVDIFRPAHAMLHLFTERELAHAAHGSRFSFDTAFCGEAHFTTWLSSLGEWRRPDPWDLQARRQFIHLPELGWANFLGNEFDGRYDATKLSKATPLFIASSAGKMFHLTNSLSDVEHNPETFEAARTKAKAAFVDGFFRQ